MVAECKDVRGSFVGACGSQPGELPADWSGGEDKLVVSCYVSWLEAAALFERLANAKIYAQNDGIRAEEACILAAGRGAYVEPCGARPGGAGPMFRYVIKGFGATFLLQASAEPKGDSPNVMVEIGSQALMVEGGRQCWENAKAFITALGGIILKNVVSRVDFCVDTMGVPMQAIADCVAEGRYITRAQCKDDYSVATFERHRQLTGIQFGRGGCVCRIYDKIAETAFEPVRRRIVEHYRWNGARPSAAVRVEFQLRRKFFRDRHADVGDGEIAEINSVEDWFEHRCSVLAYLFSDWLRLTASGVDRLNGNQQRYGSCDFWLAVAETAGRICAGKVNPVVKLTTVRAEVKQLRTQALGCLQTAGIIAGRPADSADDLAALVAELTEYARECEDEQIAKRAEKKRWAIEQSFAEGTSLCRGVG